MKELASGENKKEGEKKEAEDWAAALWRWPT
jgi:hypothetical protein